MFPFPFGYNGSIMTDMDMALTILSLFFGLPGMVGIVWAVARHQFRSCERVKYAMLEDEAEEASTEPAIVSMPPMARLLLAALALLFVPFLILLGMTVVEAVHPMPSPASGAHSAAQCPF